MRQYNRSHLSREKVAAPMPELTLSDYLAPVLAPVKLAQLQSVRETALQVSKSCVLSDQSNDKTASSGTVDSTKLAQAAAALDRLLAVTDDLRAAHSLAVKTAAALVQAVKMADDGLLDVSEILSHAREVVQEGSAKLATLGDLFDESPGETDENARVAAATDELSSFFASRRYTR